jgi:hypothetical protein
LDDHRIVPVLHLARIDRRQDGTAELQVLVVEAGHIVVDHLRRHGERNVQDAWARLHLRIAHVSVRRADLHRSGNSLGNAGAAACALRRDLHVGMSLLVIGGPLIEERQQQGRTRLQKLNLIRMRGAAEKRSGRSERSRQRDAARCVSKPAFCCHVFTLSASPGADRTQVSNGFRCARRELRRMGTDWIALAPGCTGRNRPFLCDSYVSAL